ALVSLLHRDHRRLVADDALILDVDQSVGRAEINGKVVGKDADEATPHQKTPSCARGKRLEHGENNRFTRIKQDNEKLKEKSFYPAPPGCIAPGHFLSWLCRFLPHNSERLPISDARFSAQTQKKLDHYLFSRRDDCELRRVLRRGQIARSRRSAGGRSDRRADQPARVRSGLRARRRALPA